MELLFATNNQHKIQEIQNILDQKLKIIGLKDIGFHDEIPEDQDTLEGNALQKANFIYESYKINCFADDTGLEVEALNNEPGIFSARYAGEQKSSDDNIEKLLVELKGIENRKAQFRTVVSLIINGQDYFFEGIVKGKIIHQKKGTSGFGYDPIFVPDGYVKTFAEMSLEEKNKISHRARAINKLVEFLSSEY